MSVSAPVLVTSLVWNVSASGIMVVLVASNVMVPAEAIVVLVPRVNVVTPLAVNVVSLAATVRVFEPESRVSPVVVEASVPVPAKVMAVAENPIVSTLATPVRAPPVVTFKPPAEVRAKVPVEFPIATVPVPVVAIVTLEAPALAKSVVPEEVSVVVETPVAPVIAPDPEMSREGESKRAVVNVPVNWIPLVMAPAPSAMRRPFVMVPAVPAILIALVNVPAADCSMKRPLVRVVELSIWRALVPEGSRLLIVTSVGVATSVKLMMTLLPLSVPMVLPDA